MRGSIVSRGKVKRGINKGQQAWSLILPLGCDSITKKPRQKWFTAYGTRKDAEAKLNELAGEVGNGSFVPPSKITVGGWLDEWLDKLITPRCAVSTSTGWKGIIDNHLKRAFGDKLLHQLTAFDIEHYYARITTKLAPKTIAVHHAILSGALKAAVRAKHLRTSPVSDVTNKPKLKSSQGSNVWTVEETRRFASTLKQDTSAQYKALFALALNTGLRKGELLGLKWEDLTDSKLRVERQLLTGGLDAPTFSVPKNKETRVIDVSAETLKLLLEHKRRQAEVKIGNRTTYQDYGLIFAQAWEELRSKRAQLGAPLSVMSVKRKLDRLCSAAKVRRITVHGLRHTCATLLVADGVGSKVVQKRLGHADVALTLNVYTHVLPSQQADAAARLDPLIWGAIR